MQNRIKLNQYQETSSAITVAVSYDEDHEKPHQVADLYRKFPGLQKLLSAGEQNNLNNFLSDKVNNLKNFTLNKVNNLKNFLSNKNAFQ